MHPRKIAPADDHNSEIKIPITSTDPRSAGDEGAIRIPHVSAKSRKVAPASLPASYDLTLPSSPKTTADHTSHFKAFVFFRI